MLNTVVRMVKRGELQKDTSIHLVESVIFVKSHPCGYNKFVRADTILSYFPLIRCFSTCGRTLFMILEMYKGEDGSKRTKKV